MEVISENIMWQQRIQSAIESLKSRGRYRQRIECEQQGSTINIQVEGKTYVNFSSNDYLGLAHHPRMIKAAQLSAQKEGVGSGGSGYVTGYSTPLKQLEATLADWLGYEAAIVYPSGFTANQAVIKLLIERGDNIIADRLSHASLLEAAMFSEGRLHRFKHNDLASLESYLVKTSNTGNKTSATCSENGDKNDNTDSTDSLFNTQEQRTEITTDSHSLNLVVTEGVFSMDGDTAPLPEIALLTEKHGGLLMVDDAHGIGLLGEDGKGTCNHYGIQPDILVVTFGKAFGASGAAILMSQELADYCLQFSRPLIYSTAIAPMQASILLEAINIIRGQEGMLRRIQLQRNISYFKSAFMKEIANIQDLLTLKQLRDNEGESSIENLPQLPYLLTSESAIQPLIIGDDHDAMALSSQMKDANIWVSAIRPPTVPNGTARLRITLTAEHTKAMIDQFLEAFSQAMIDIHDLTAYVTPQTAE